MYSNNAEMNITNFGNQNVNVSIRAYGGNNEISGAGLAMLCTNGQNMSVDNHRFAIASSTSFALKTSLLSTNQDMGLTVRKQTNPAVISINSTYLQLYVPPMQISFCNGTVVYTVAAP
jgi:hypothetical protein